MLCTAWSPNGQSLASACKKGEVCIWDPETGKQKGKPLLGHKQWVTSLAWEPLHLNPSCRKLASSSKDGDVRIWDVIIGNCLINLAGHQQGVSCIRWGGQGLIYSASQVSFKKNGFIDLVYRFIFFFLRIEPLKFGDRKTEFYVEHSRAMRIGLILWL